ncbi:MAG: type IV secretory system conjugative DNA transfer family protein [Paracoccus sp. (in: a-proteobacteria)]
MMAERGDGKRRLHRAALPRLPSLPDTDLMQRIHLGTSEGRYRDTEIYIPAKDRLQHTYIIGATGTGKTSLLLHMLKQDAKDGTGFAFIDPHGDAAEELAYHLGNRCLYWNVADPACPIGYNPLRHVTPAYRPLVASNLIEALKQQWHDAWGVRMEHLLRFAILALLEIPGTSISDILPLYLDRAYRQEVIAQLSDPQQLAFWQDEFPKLGYMKAGDGLAPIANKLGAFLAHPLVRRAVTEPATPLPLRQIMDTGQPLIVNLGKGRLGADTANVLGGLVITSLANAAYSRQTVPATDRRPFALYIDEFQSFTSRSLADMLPSLRKYGVGLTLATQSTTGTDTAITDAILANTGTIIAFRVGPKDAEVLARVFGERDLEGRELQKLVRGRGMVKLGTAVAFTIQTLHTQS